MSNDDTPNTATPSTKSTLPPDRPDDGPPAGRHSSHGDRRSELSDDVHAISRGGGATGGWLQRRREKVIAEIERNRRGEYLVPTWVLAVLLVAIVGAWAALIILS